MNKMNKSFCLGVLLACFFIGIINLIKISIAGPGRAKTESVDISGPWNEVPSKIKKQDKELWGIIKDKALFGPSHNPAGKVQDVEIAIFHFDEKGGALGHPSAKSVYTLNWTSADRTWWRSFLIMEWSQLDGHWVASNTIYLE